MGTDIHMAAEVRKNGKWTLVRDKVFKNSWYEPDPSKQRDYNRNEFTNIPYDERNYNLFAMLADVRNGYGFAGCVTGQRINPISAPKGYPEDLSDELKRDIDPDIYHSDEYRQCMGSEDRPYLSDEHSASYLTLQELLDYDWDQGHKTIGYLTQSEYASSIYKGKHPESWCGGVGGGNVVKVSEQEMIDIIEGRYRVNPDKEYYTQCVFPSRTYKEKAGSFYTDTIPALKKLIPEGGTPSDVRIVFDFDS